MPGPYVAGENAWTPLWFGWRSDYAAFPSGHATTAFAAAIAIGALWPKLRPVMWVYAVAIAVSRVIVTAHHPSDVIAGAIVGTIGALLVRNWYASRRLGLRSWRMARSIGCRDRPGGVLKRLPAARSLLRTRRVTRVQPIQSMNQPNPSAPDVSVIVPVRNEAGNVAPLVAEITAALEGRWPFEMIYVNDGSSDGTGRSCAC